MKIIHTKCLWISNFFQIFTFIGSLVIGLSLSEIPIWTHQREFGLSNSLVCIKHIPELYLHCLHMPCLQYKETDKKRSFWLLIFFLRWLVQQVWYIFMPWLVQQVSPREYFSLTGETVPQLSPLPSNTGRTTVQCGCLFIYRLWIR